MRNVSYRRTHRANANPHTTTSTAVQDLVHVLVVERRIVLVKGHEQRLQQLAGKYCTAVVLAFHSLG